MPVYTWLNDTRGTRRALSQRSGFGVQVVNGFSLPDLDHISARAPQQHGATYLATYFRPRQCSMVLSVRGRSADDYQGKHRLLVQEFNPLDECRLQIETDGSVRYWLGCRVVAAIQVNFLNSRASEVLVQLIADDPHFYTAEDIVTFASSLSGGLFIAFTVPGIISSPSNQVAFIVTNGGHVLTYPIITLDGPVDNPALYNDTLGQSLAVTELVPAGSQLVVDMGNRTAKVVTGGVETNVLGSCVGTFWGLAVGSNAIRIISDNPAVFSGTMAFYERYMAAV